MKVKLVAICMGFFLALVASCSRLQAQNTDATFRIIYDEDIDVSSTKVREVIDSVINNTVQRGRELLADLPDLIEIHMYSTDHDLDIVGGVTGRTDLHTPKGQIQVIISTRFPGGLVAAARTGLASTLLHELHHVAKGWSMEGNIHPGDIATAIVLEGLAVVFAELHTGRKFEANQYPHEVDDWVEEILELPDNADYTHWVSGTHPDGRTFIGYRAGKYVVERALKQSGMNIVRLSHVPPGKIFDLAGFK